MSWVQGFEGRVGLSSHSPACRRSFQEILENEAKVKRQKARVKGFEEREKMRQEKKEERKEEKKDEVEERPKKRRKK
eukprot:10007906-Karenia_brevis.AAC.1